jgi:predicted AlkP superfamily phosphohydrolase/phosphomutase
VNGATIEGAFRLKLLALDPRAGLFRLYVTDICRLSWLEHPPHVLGDTRTFAGLPTPGVGWDSFGSGAIDLDTFVDLTGMATAWLADTCAKLIREQPWDLFCTHFHAIDSFYHLCCGGLDEHLTPDAGERRRFEAAELAIYRQLDAALARLVGAADEPVLVALVSDHGATPPGPPVPMLRILRDAGLLSVEGPASDGGRGVRSGPVDPSGDGERIDWSRTLAAPQGSCYVRLNLVGREPCGVVEPRDAGRVCGRVVRALRAYRDPATGVCPFSLVTAKEGAAALGLHGDGVGDVVYAVHPEFSDEHGQMLPRATRSSGGWGMPALCLFAGDGAAAPGDVAGVSLADVAPTLCHALGVPRPLQSEGSVRSALLAPRPSR